MISRMNSFQSGKRAIHWSEVVDAGLSKHFAEIAAKNNTSAEEVLSSFIKDYIVSGGHPETVVNKWPWSRQQ